MENPQIKHNFIENNIIMLSKQTLDLFLKQNNPSDLIGLYSFYYYTAKWQQTDQPKCTTIFTAKALHWGEQKTIKTKRTLIELGLIEDLVITNKNGQIKGHYIKINYIWKQSTIKNNSLDLNEKTTPPQTAGVEVRETNALSAINENALSAITIESKDSIVAESNSAIDNGLNLDSSPTNKERKKEDKPLYDLLSYKNRSLKIVGLLAKAIGSNFKSREQQQSFIQKNIKAAKALLPYSDEKIFETIVWMYKNVNHKITLWGVGKYIDNDLKQLDQRMSKNKIGIGT